MTDSVITEVPAWQELLRKHSTLLLSLAAVWFAFVAMEVGKGFYFNGNNTPFFYYLVFGLYLYVPWFLFSVICGQLAYRTRLFSFFSNQSLRVHVPIACLFAILHVLVLTSAYWVFWPERVSRVSFQFVFGEQAIQWMHFELLAYFILLHVWRRQLVETETSGSAQSESDNSSQLALSTDSGVVKVDQEQVEWLLADDNYVIVHTAERKLRVRSTLKEMLAQLKRLQGNHFLQAHRSAIVNMNKVREIGSQRLVLNSGHRVPVSRRRHRQLLEAFNRS